MWKARGKKVRWTLLHTSIPEVNIFTGDVHNIFSQIAWNTDSAMHFTYHKKDRIENREKRGSISIVRRLYSISIGWKKVSWKNVCIARTTTLMLNPPRTFLLRILCVKCMLRIACKKPGECTALLSAPFSLILVVGGDWTWLVFYSSLHSKTFMIISWSCASSYEC